MREPFININVDKKLKYTVKFQRILIYIFKNAFKAENTTIENFMHLKMVWRHSLAMDTLNSIKRL